MRAVVLGAGIGGLTTALALRRVGIAAQVFEQAPELREVGAGIQMSPNGTRLLERLGLAEPLRRVAVRPVALEMRRWSDGAVLSQQPLADACEAAFGAPYYHLYRPDLVAVLAAALPPGTIHLAHRFVSLRQRADGVEISFANGATVTADVVVGADGIHSAVRDAVVGRDSPWFSGSIAYRGLVPAERLAHLQLNRSVIVWLGPDRHFVHYFVAGGRLMNFVGAVPAGDGHAESWSTMGRVANVLAEFADWHPQVRAIIAAAEAVNCWGLYDRRPLERWSLGRVALLGDAAHAMLPFMAQGAVQAVEDAVVLARCLDGVDRAGASAALRRYEASRRARASRVQARARQNGEMFHLRDGDAQRERDAHFAAAGSNNPLLASAWLYGHDAEASGAPGPRSARIEDRLLETTAARGSSTSVRSRIRYGTESRPVAPSPYLRPAPAARRPSVSVGIGNRRRAGRPCCGI